MTTDEMIKLLARMDRRLATVEDQARNARTGPAHAGPPRTAPPRPRPHPPGHDGLRRHQRKPPHRQGPAAGAVRASRFVSPAPGDPGNPKRERGPGPCHLRLRTHATDLRNRVSCSTGVPFLPRAARAEWRTAWRTLKSLSGHIFPGLAPLHKVHRNFFLRLPLSDDEGRTGRRPRRRRGPAGSRRRSSGGGVRRKSAGPWHASTYRGRGTTASVPYRGRVCGDQNGEQMGVYERRWTTRT